ncbi:MAG: pentapeptide repeat-containing protein [Aphanocapsa lilacina HA4352-LM1]|nr:pentapeptide repeat-containing protein [Aphanocapsa lilacina HA4352-LM1]
MRQANLERANLAGADLSGADLRWSRLVGREFDRGRAGVR